MKTEVTAKRGLTFVAPSLRDPRIMIAAALTLWTTLGQTAYYFNRDLRDLVAAIGTACALDLILGVILFRQFALTLSAYITGLSIAILLESNDWRVYVVASTWGILSKYLLRDSKRHFFNPSNFAIVMTLLLCHGIASVAPGSQSLASLGRRAERPNDKSCPVSGGGQDGGDRGVHGAGNGPGDGPGRGRHSGSAS